MISLHLKIGEILKELKDLESDKSRCFWCGRELSKENRTRDHFWPASRWRKIFNKKVYSCDACNSAKSDLLPEDFEKIMYFKIECGDKDTPYQNYKQLVIKKKYMVRIK